MNTKQTANPASPEPEATRDLISGLATVYAPLMPLLKKIKSSRSGRRNHVPADINLPADFVAEVVTTELNAPVHCAFDNAATSAKAATRSTRSLASCVRT
jgi:hypothetical protein